MEIGPGETTQPIHRDGLLYPLRHPTFPFIVACMWAQSAFTAHNGGTRLAPGSHLWAHEREPEEHEIVSAEMPAGSVVWNDPGRVHATRSGTRPWLSFWAWLDHIDDPCEVVFPSE